MLKLNFNSQSDKPEIDYTKELQLEIIPVENTNDKRIKELEKNLFPTGKRKVKKPTLN